MNKCSDDDNDDDDTRADAPLSGVSVALTSLRYFFLMSIVDLSRLIPNGRRRIGARRLFV